MAVEHPAVKNVSVISTGSVEMHREHMYGTRKPGLWWVTRGKEWIADVPLNVFVIEHDDGLVLFDTGMDPAAATDPDYWNVAGDWADSVVRSVLHRVFRFEIGPDDRLGSQLEKAGYRTEDVKAAVLSHLHFDHVGGIGDIPGAELFVSPDAWDVVQKAKHPERDYVARSRILVPGARWQLLDFAPIDDPDLAPFTEACDVMGDGSLMVVPTPGHNFGSVSMLIRSADAPPILLIGDLSYSADLLFENQVPGLGDKAVLLESFAKVQAMKAHTPDLVIVASHDTTAVSKLEAARVSVLATT
jgi:glyoxylase-like metal-dependent hydrolase (beta-lactamase superfamily II)